ncbi:MAG: hypothetical protein NTZ67_09550 [Gammaproteobacteria bacterium]|nr:hypothetical protein [Gammaproteobacteria bacterium]
MLYNHYKLVVTTQGPTYPPSEIMDEEGNFVVIGVINSVSEVGGLQQEWNAAIVAHDSPVPEFGKNLPYKIIKKIDLKNLKAEDDCVLYALPLPLPCHNYPMIFAPEQSPVTCARRHCPLHEVPIPDLRPQDGRKITRPIMLSDWIRAEGELTVRLVQNQTAAAFDFKFKHLIPNSLYTIMALRQFDLDALRGPTRPGPLGVPNVFITDNKGRGSYSAIMPNPFSTEENGNRIISVVVLWMSTQMSYGGAIGHYGLGGDIHAQLKLPGKFFLEFTTH